MFLQFSSVKKLVLVLAVVALLAVPMAGVASAADEANGITTPADGATVSGTVEVMGYAGHEDSDNEAFDRWQLDLLPSGEEANVFFLAVGNDQGQFTYSLDTAALPVGDHALRLRVVFPSGNYREYLTNFTVAATETTAEAPVVPVTLPAAVPVTLPAVVTPTVAAVASAVMANGITLPKATADGNIEVKGFATNPDFSKWQLDLLRDGQDAKAIFLSFGDKIGDFTYSLATAGLPVGQHALRLRVVRNDSNYDEYFANLLVGAAVTGTVTYLQRSALAPDSVVKVTLQDVSLADAPAQVIGEQSIVTEGKQVPIAYSVVYDPSVIVENHSYVVRAQIFDGQGTMLFTSDTAIPVITRNAPTSDVEIVVVPVQ